LHSLFVIEAAEHDWAALSGRSSGGLLEVDGDAHSEFGILCLGSVYGTFWEARQSHPELPDTRLIKLRAYRPFPAQAIRQACHGLKKLLVLERALSPGSGGIVSAEVLVALSELPQAPKVYSVAAGLGGRDIPLQLYPRLHQHLQQEDTSFHIIDLQRERLGVEDFGVEEVI